MSRRKWEFGLERSWHRLGDGEVVNVTLYFDSPVDMWEAHRIAEMEELRRVYDIPFIKELKIYVDSRARLRRDG
jgi:hypothetical protein